MQEHRVESREKPEKLISAVGEAAEMWGADWERESSGGRLHLPVAAGLRHGVVRGRLRVEAARGGSLAVFEPEESTYYVHTPAVAILLIAALGGLLVMAWPFFPGLGPLAPLGAVLALSGWFLVVARLHTRGPEEFFELVKQVDAGDFEGTGR